MTESLRAFILSRNDGTVLTSVSLDSDINEPLLSSFISALWILGSKSVGKFSELCLKGKSDYNLVIVSKYNLLLTVLLESANTNYDYLKDDLYTFLTHLYRKFRNNKSKNTERELHKELHNFCKRKKTNKVFWSNLSKQVKIAECS
jgi:hypothetical protein